MVSRAVARKTVSVLFCDLADSTALGEHLDPEPLRELMGAWYEAMRTVVESHGGTVEKFVGDAVMAVFGLPRAHEDDALRAVRAALEMQSAVERLNSSLSERDVPELHVRIGINTGVVVTGDEAATLVTGDAVNTAKRLEQAAGGGEILVGAVTERLIRHAARLERVAPIDAKGKSAPVDAWRVLDVLAGAEPFARRWDTPLVGRRRELAVLREELAASADGRGCRLVTVVGAAGVGKTRLVTEFVAELGDYATVARGRCLAYGDGITFWPLAELLRGLGGEGAVADAMQEEPDGPLVIERLGALTGGTSSPEELFWAVRRLFETLGRRRPLVVVLEDVHWAEATFLDLVEHVSRWSRDAPILLLCIARPELLEERPRWEGAVLQLEPLSTGEAAELLKALDSAGAFSPDLRRRVAETAQGNPLYTEQLVAMLEDADAELSELPPTIQALLSARLDRLEPAEREVLERAAVVGKDFWPGAIAALGEGEEALGATLLDLVRRELVEPAASTIPGEDGFSFRHALIRDAAYASTPLRRRAAHHERFATWIADAAAGEEYDEFRGYHLEQAVRLHGELGSDDEHVQALAGEAHQLLADAGRRAYARGDAPAARNLLERALALDARDELELQRLLAHAHWETGDTRRALHMVESVAAKAAAVGARAEEWYARLDVAGMRGATETEDLLPLLETAARAVEVFSELDDERGLAQAWRRVSRVEFVRGSYAAAAGAAERALNYALRCGEGPDAARAADVLCTALLWGPMPAADAIQRCEELIEAVEVNDVLRAAALAALAGLHGLRSELAEARKLCAEAGSIYRDLGHRNDLVGLSQIAAQIERLADDPVAAEAELRAGVDVLGGGDNALQQGWLAAALVAQGRYEEAREPAEAARACAAPADVLADVVWRGALARVEAAAGRTEAAVELGREAVDRAALTDGLTMRADALLDLAAVLDAAGQPNEAARATAEAAALYDEKAGGVFPRPGTS